ncbi:UNVERIFIED_ORG: uncharacterized protein YkwD [Zoogloea ramigera]|uniref:CAP domain-containing protein n=1 Tax=Duganella zoogloeoides TaxID=75659 RepID=A0ABZ0XYD2_9BURK|nr:CAP domain-containing protein [Duganella zoogloeoides]WQH04756.1 CAP domain-containing protein [Duganella zoogloeoides]
MRTIRRPSLSASPALLAAAVIAALLAGCGGGGGGESSAPGAVVTAPPEQTGTPTTPTIPSNAPALTGNTATDGFNWFNYRRAMLGLSALTRNTTIDTAALGHSQYLRLNNTISHDQATGQPGFTGIKLTNRLAAAGYTLGGRWAIGEVISAASNTSGHYHADELIAAIYHRFVIFEPVFKEIGTGAVTANGTYTYFTADVAANNGLGSGLGAGKIAVYPVAGQTAVPTNFFSDREEPDPVPDQNEVGYPISVHADSGRSGDLTVQSFTVAPRGGAALTTRLLSHASDAATGSTVAAIVPLTVLRGNTTYDVSFRGAVHGVAVAQDWSFTTR